LLCLSAGGSVGLLRGHRLATLGQLTLNPCYEIVYAGVKVTEAKVACPLEALQTRLNLSQQLFPFG
jgi:hypothetical protein